MTDIRTRAADIIEPHINGKFKVRDRAEGVALDLYTYGLLAGSEPWDNKLPVAERAVNNLQCRLGQIVAERVVADLAAAGLLKLDEAVQ